jgi:hypothetical protein
VGQVLPQLPQLAVLVARLTHAPEQLVSPAAQETVQALFTQDCPPPQTMPQPPQLLGSVWVFAQKKRLLLPHNVCPAEQTAPQVPATQVCPTGQTLRQEPQWLGSVPVFTHTPLHTVPPAQKEVTQTPLVQVVPALHTVPHAPQLFWSVCSFTQTLPHITWLAGQPDTQTPPVHVPLEHCAADVQAPPADASPQPPSMQGVPVAQAVPHAPQLEESAVVVVQNPLQVVPGQVSVSPAACILYSTSRLASAPVFEAQVEPVRREACNTSPALKVMTMAPVSDQFWPGLRTRSWPLVLLVSRKTAPGQVTPVAVFATAAMRRTVIA